MAREKLRITKEWLQQHGIVDVSKEGLVTGVKGEKKVFTITTKHPFGKDKSYHAIAVYDKDLYKEKGYGGTRTLMLSRIMYAWYYGIWPEDFDVDHIDNNSLNDTLDNLRLLSRVDNNRRHKPRNKILAKLSEDQLEEYLDKMKELKQQSDKIREEVYYLRSQKLQAESQLRDIKRKFKNKELSYQQYEIFKALWETDYANIKENLKTKKDSWSSIKEKMTTLKNAYLYLAENKEN